MSNYCNRKATVCWVAQKDWTTGGSSICLSDQFKRMVWHYSYYSYFSLSSIYCPPAVENGDALTVPLIMRPLIIDKTFPLPRAIPWTQVRVIPGSVGVPGGFHEQVFWWTLVSLMTYGHSSTGASSAHWFWSAKVGHLYFLDTASTQSTILPGQLEKKHLKEILHIRLKEHDHTNKTRK